LAGRDTADDAKAHAADSAGLASIMLDLLPASVVGLFSSSGQDCVALSDLKLGATVGVGGFARVRVAKAKDHPEAAPMALKIQHKATLIKRNHVDSVKAEVELLRTFDHPFIVKLHSCWQDLKSIYMLMDFVNGGELFSVIHKCTISEEEAQLWTAELALAIEYLHSKDVVHRDIKPENTLVDNEGHLRLTDFGFAKVVKTRLWTLCGTPMYVAPEVILQTNGYGCGVDWWSLGVVTYEILTGFAPFRADTISGIHEKILKGEFSTPSHLTAEATDLIRKLLTGTSQRLGCTKEGVAGIKKHAWFSTVDFNDVLHRRVPSSYIPKVTSAEDTSQFDKYPENDEADLPPLSVDQQALFNFDCCERRSTVSEWIPSLALVGWGCCSSQVGKHNLLEFAEDIPTS
jgi:serine/threonine protein kinase